MKHIQLFEAYDADPSETESTYSAPRRNAVPDLSSLKDTQEYQDLLAAGFIDVSDENPMGLRQGNLRFSHSALGNRTIGVRQVGSIFMDFPSGKASLIDRGSPLMSIEDYAARLATIPHRLLANLP